jgi:flagellar basal-body rod protein FlgG
MRALSIASTGMLAQQTNVEVIANNLANMNTTAFKQARAEFTDLLYQNIQTPGSQTSDQGTYAPNGVQLGAGVRTAAVYRIMTQGDLKSTGNPYDVAIQGAGFFRIQRPNGEFAYTRAGNFRVDATGRICTQNGEVVEPGITVPPETTALTINPDGKVMAKVPGRDDPSEIGTIELTMFANPGGLEAVGGNLLKATASSGEPINLKPGEQSAGSVTQGFLEGANVKAVEEMIDMITTQRAYEMNSKVIQTADQMLQRLTQMR